MTLNILIVDDSKLVRAMIRQSLEMAQVQFVSIEEAGNGLEGIDALRKHSADLVFCDIHMPEMDGIAMIEAMQKSETLKSIPVIVISSEGGKQQIEHLERLGIQSYIRKPFTPEMVSEAVERVLEQ